MTQRSSKSAAQKAYDQALKAERTGRVYEAIKLYQKAAKLAPTVPEILNNLATCLRQIGKHQQALSALARADALRPHDPVILTNRVGALLQAGDLDGARAEAEAILARHPRHTPAALEAAAACEASGDVDGALATLEAHAEPAPNSAAFWRTLGRLRHFKNLHEEALAALETAEKIEPGGLIDNAALYQLRRECVVWDGLDALDRRMRAAVAGDKIPAEAGSPFRYVGRTEDPYLQLKIGRSAAERRKRMAAAMGKPMRAPAHPDREGPLRVGYISADMRNHPMMKLMAGLFRRHDPARVSVHLYAVNRDDGDPLRAEAAAGAHKFHDLSGKPSLEIAQTIRGDELDLLVDLMSYTRNARGDALALRPAPVQATWLAFPGTSGADYFDYVIADRTVLPPEDADTFAETPAWLPNSYFLYDETTRVADPGTRADHSLPETGAVFVCFNQTFKIDAMRFATWMAILRRVPGSVLWLLFCPDGAEARLRAAAEAAGVAPERLIFAPRAPHAEHLARLSLADLTLDTWLYGAHTTAADSLWVGVPVLTRRGPTFASRAPASIVTAAGLPELVTESEQEFEDLAVALAEDPHRLSEIKSRAQAARTTAPLFDNARFARDMETLYEAMVTRSRRGEAPTPLAID